MTPIVSLSRQHSSFQSFSAKNQISKYICNPFNGCHFVYFVMYISGAKFEERRSHISRDILDSVFYCLSKTTKYLWRHRFPHLHNTKRHSSLFWNAFQISSNYFAKDLAHITSHRRQQKKRTFFVTRTGLFTAQLINHILVTSPI